MIFKRLNRTSPEQVFAVFSGGEAGIAADDAVQLQTASANGVNLEQPTTSPALQLTVGIADAAIASGGYGLVQIYGYRSTSRVLLTGASITPGGTLALVADQDYLETAASGAKGLLPVFAAVDSFASSGTTATASGKIFIRCM